MMFARSKLPDDAVPPEVKLLIDAYKKGEYDTTMLEALIASLYYLGMSGSKGSTEAIKLLLQIIGEDVTDKQEVKIVYDEQTKDLMG